MPKLAYKANIDFFLKNKSRLSKKYPGKVLLIAEGKIQSSFPNEHKAYLSAIKQYKPGEFITQPVDFETKDVSHYYSNVRI